MYNFSLFLNFLVIQIDFKITKKLLTAILGKRKGKPQANQTITKEDTSIMISLIPKKSHVQKSTNYIIPLTKLMTPLI